MNSYTFTMWMLLPLGIAVLALINRLRVIDPNMSVDKRLRLALHKQHVLVKILWLILLVLFIGSMSTIVWVRYKRDGELSEQRKAVWPAFDREKIWEAPDSLLAKTDAHPHLISYGRDLIANTQDYFGQDGLVRAGAINAMNCQNCHLDAGTKPYGNNFFAVQSTYPQYRPRLGALETVAERVNDCFQRSLNGHPLDTTSHEMRAILAYIRWLGTGVPKGESPKGHGVPELEPLKRAANPITGETVYKQKCVSCHGPDGQGLNMPDSPRFYPPLWGPRSYNEGAGLFRLSRLAAYVKANMPFGTNYQNPQLSDEEAWDVAAFINSRPRHKHPFLATDWPDISQKPYDHPFGPFTDTFPAEQHKFGPFGPIIAFHKAQKK